MLTAAAITAASVNSEMRGLVHHGSVDDVDFSNFCLNHLAVDMHADDEKDSKVDEKGAKGGTAGTHQDTDKMKDNDGNLVALNPRKRISFKLVKKEVNTLRTFAKSTEWALVGLAIVRLRISMTILNGYDNTSGGRQILLLIPGAGSLDHGRRPVVPAQLFCLMGVLLHQVDALLTTWAVEGAEHQPQRPTTPFCAAIGQAQIWADSRPAYIPVCQVNGPHLAISSCRHQTK